MTKKESRKRRNFHSCGSYAREMRGERPPWNLAAKLVIAADIGGCGQTECKKIQKRGKKCSWAFIIFMLCEREARKPTKPTNKKRARDTQRDTNTQRDGEQGRADSGRGSSAVRLHWWCRYKCGEGREVGGVASPSILLVATLAEGALSSFVLNLVPTKKTISLNSSSFFLGGCKSFSLRPNQWKLWNCTGKAVEEGCCCYCCCHCNSFFNLELRNLSL